MKTPFISSNWSRCEGASLILVLFLIVLLTILGFSILFITDVDLKTSRNYRSSARATALAEAGINEAIYRMNLRDIDTTVPTGYRVTVNSLSNYDARILLDPHELMTDGVDNDGDGTYDEVDELHPTRGWTARILLSETDPSPGTLRDWKNIRRRGKN